MTVHEDTVIDPLRKTVVAFTSLLEHPAIDEQTILDEGKTLLGDLVASDNWLPGEFAQPHAEHYQQYLLHCDPQERFSIVSFVWGPGQKTPVHDHTVWGLVGMLRGAESAQAYELRANGQLQSGATDLLEPGDVVCLSPSEGDIHQVANAYADQVSISVHVYGGNIGAVQRHTFDPTNGARKAFVSGYAASVVPNLWDRSDEVRASVSRHA